MSHDHPRFDQQTPKGKLWAVQEQLHDLARHLDHPAPSGAQYPSDLYDLLGALKVTTRDIADITHRATRLLTDASDHNLTTRPLSDTDRRDLKGTHRAAWHLAEALEQAQTAINDIGGHLTLRQPGLHGRAPRQPSQSASPPTSHRPATPPPQGRRR